MFPQSCGCAYIIIVHGNDTVNDARACEIADAFNHIVYFRKVRHIEQLIDALAGPVRMLQFRHGHQDHMTALSLAFTQKLLPLLVTTEAEYGLRRDVCHCLTPESDGSL